MIKNRVVVVGGGAAGVFAATAAAEVNPSAEIVLLERTATLLSKVRISGGGRCNVTHVCFDPALLIQNYPRGGKALRGPFSRFQPKDTIAWFEKRGVPLKAEEDGRVFPVSDSSQTIIDCLVGGMRKNHVQVRFQQRLEKIEKKQDEFVLYAANNEQSIHCQKLILATGNSPQGYSLAQNLGHSIVSPVPSLFTFNVPTSPLLDLAGISVEIVTIGIEDTSFIQQGPLLLTHWGFSGPAVLKLSAWAARHLHDVNYRANLVINWLGDLSSQECQNALRIAKEKQGSSPIGVLDLFGLPRNLWKRLVTLSRIENSRRLAHLSQKEISQFVRKLTCDVYPVEGKTTYKQEFVTCGGVSLDEVDFRTMESRICPGLFFAGEILDIDGITGGFNFQSAWTTAWIAAHASPLLWSGVGYCP